MCLTRDEEWESGQVTTGPAIEKTTTRRKKEANGSRTWVEETDLSDEKRRLLGSTRAWNVQKGGIVSRQTDSNGREKWPKSHRPHSNSFYQKNLPSSFSLSLRQIEKTTTWLQCSLFLDQLQVFSPSFIITGRTCVHRSRGYSSSSSASSYLLLFFFCFSLKESDGIHHHRYRRRRHRRTLSLSFRSAPVIRSFERQETGASKKEEEEMLNLLPPTWFPSSCPAACISNDPSSWFGCIASIASVFSID